MEDPETAVFAAAAVTAAEKVPAASAVHFSASHQDYKVRDLFNHNQVIQEKNPV